MGDNSVDMIPTALDNGELGQTRQWRINKSDSSCMANIKFSATQNGRFCLHTCGHLYFEYSKVTVSWLSL